MGATSQAWALDGHVGGVLWTWHGYTGSHMAEEIKVSRNSQLEKESLLRIEGALLPWRMTRPEQGDDFGRDAFVQIVRGSPAGIGTLSPLMFASKPKVLAHRSERHTKSSSKYGT
jgi:hypothetical protein